ncbi:MAG: hypothetical protein ACM3XS_08555 [Bacteroidota bacterium]
MHRWLLVPALALAVLLTVPPVLAKPKKGTVIIVQPARPAGEIDFLAATFGLDRSAVARYIGYGLQPDELALILYFHAVSGRPLGEAQLRIIARERDWNRAAWYFGLPPIMLEDGLLVLRRPWRARLFVPAGLGEYKNEKRGAYEEKIAVTPHKYEYKYEDKRLGIEEKLEITRDKYEYKYEDRAVEEKVSVDLRSYRYEYKYKDRRSGLEIKKHGIGRPLTPALVLGQCRAERKKDPGFRLTVRLEIGF